MACCIGENAYGFQKMIWQHCYIPVWHVVILAMEAQGSGRQRVLALLPGEIGVEEILHWELEG